MNNTSSNRNANISAHLVNMRKIVEVCCTLALAKTKIQNTVLVSPWEFESSVLLSIQKKRG
jgi:hypothetical protein